MWITVHMGLPVFLVGSATLFALGYATGKARTRITRRKRRP